jgi:UDP-N-acetylmuramate dehydrogenase
VLVETRSGDEIVDAVKIAGAAGVGVTVLGGGSNVLIGDGGIRGLVIRLKGGDVMPIGDRLVRADAAVTINGLVRWTINRGLAGLEAWAGTPGTVGGAIYGNAHWKKTNIGELVESVRLVTRQGALLQAPADRMEFDYDYSRLKRTGETVLWAAFRVTPGADPAALRAVARESLAFRKRTQPLESPSAGCIFMNPDPARDPIPEGIPASAGALVDRAGLKGAAYHGARVSLTHANFIINDGSAAAADIHALVERCRAAVKDRFGVTLQNEIIYLGDF